MIQYHESLDCIIGITGFDRGRVQLMSAIVRQLSRFNGVLQSLPPELLSVLRQMQPKSKLRATFLVLFVALPCFADDLINADRPGIADGSTTVDAGKLQVEIGAERDSGNGPSSTSTPLLIRYGLTKGLEARVETAGFIRAAGDDGFAPISAGMKYHFLDRPSLGLIARVFPHSGSGAFKSHKTTADLRLAADRDLSEQWSIEGNIGVEHGDGNSGLLAATLQYNIKPTLNVFIDGGATTNPSSLLLDAGAAWIIGNDLQLDVSVGFGARGDVPDRFVSAGISRRF